MGSFHGRRSLSRQILLVLNITMSFGFSVGDFIAVLQLVNNIRARFDNAPEQFKAISNEVTGLSNVLRDIESVQSQQELTDWQKNALVPVLKECHNTLIALGKEPDDVHELRSRVTLNISLLNAFNGSLISKVTLATKDGVERLHKRQDTQEHRQETRDREQEHIEELTTRFSNDLTVGIVHLYCNFRRKDEQKAQDLLASLLKQLSEKPSSLPNNVKSLYGKHKEKRTRPSLDEISRTLQSVGAVYSRVFIIINALDECQISDGYQQRFLSSLFNFQERCGANLFATSWPISSIEKEFEGNLRLEIRASEQDVRRYLNGHMFRLPGFVTRSLEFQEEIKTGIVKAVDGMFLLAQLHLESLTGKRSPKAIRAALGNLATGSGAYDYAYEDSMERISGQIKDQEDLAKQVLSWIICAKRPLRTTELQHALGVEVSESRLDEDNLPEIEDVVSVCAGLVTIDEESGIIRLVHYTAQEYFERTQRQWFLNAETDITIICVTYLSFDEFESGICRADDEYEQRLQSNKLYDYASHNWGHHAREASTLIPEVVSFLERNSHVKASSQGLLVEKWHSFDMGYSQRFPKDMMGLHLAVYFGVGAIVALLLEKGAELETKDNYGRTPLSWATEHGHAAVVALLLEKGAELETKDNYSRTPLSWAAENDYAAVVALLLEKGAELETKDIDGRTPLSWATKNEHAAVVALLLEKGTELETKNNYGRTPL
ncbi:hypothetical protein BKA61DRAFT_652397 [Leptodontidium sp. MPI-SDFR-AT-0119]|nr:hypothetical protein BKA61DRAFT_652397 [Leptodontidium sp. MPI-SDFR-AT-0119]